MKAEQCPSGFTLIEVLIVIAIAAILFAIVLSGFSGLRQETDLSLAAQDSVAFLQQARIKTLSSESSSSYGVHFETSKFTLFTGNTYDSVDPSNKDRILPTSVDISSISLAGGGADVVFKRLTGETAAYGSVTFRLTSDPIVTRVIKIEPTGLSHTP